MKSARHVSSAPLSDSGWDEVMPIDDADLIALDHLLRHLLDIGRRHSDAQGDAACAELWEIAG